MCRRLSVVIIVMVGSMTFMVLFALWMYQPRHAQSSDADAIVVLAGADDGRHQLGIDWGHTNQVRDVYLSNPDGPLEPKTFGLCRASDFDAIEVTCFTPVPPTTVGEALTVQGIAHESGWHSVVVVTNRPHSHRAEAIFEHCTDLSVEIEATEWIDIPNVGRHLAREVAGALKYWATQPCRDIS